MKLNWVMNDFICKELYTPFVVEKDSDYIDHLRKKFDLVLKQAKNAGADAESIYIIQKYKTKIQLALECYYEAAIAECNIIILSLLEDIGDDSFAVSELKNSSAFYGDKTRELQLFRCRLGDPSSAYTAKDMLHLPRNLRAKSGNYRFSIPGNPSLYLSNSSYGCWIETGFPPESEFNVSPVLLDGTQKVFNLAVYIRDFFKLNEFEEGRVHCWLKLCMLSVATSYRIKEQNRVFKSEYIISQAIMMACRKLGYDGVAYYSKRVNDDVFARCAVNLALFVRYDGEYSEIVKHMKMDDAFNYGLYKQLSACMSRREYELRSVHSGMATNIGTYDRQYSYQETEFSNFDKFLFATWKDKGYGRGKDQVNWGIEI